MMEPAFRVFVDHETVGEHPLGSREQLMPDRSLLVTEPDGTTRPYGPEDWHVASETTCGGMRDRPDCPRCHPPRS